MRPAVFLDRDNTIIHNDGDLGDPDAVVLMKGAAPAIASLRGLGFRVVIVTNQGGVARGLYSEEDVHAVHDRISDLVAQQANGAKIDAFYYCPYHPEGKVEKYTREHPSRKPAPGMLLQAAEDLKLDLPVSWMVGDQLRDIEAGHAAGTRTILLHGAAPVPPHGGEGQPDFCASGMVEAVRIIAQQRSTDPRTEFPRPRKPGEPMRRQWDGQRIAEIQHPRTQPPGETPEPGQPESDPPLGPGAKAEQRGRPAEFRPWSVGEPGVDKPIVPSPFRKRFFREEEEGGSARPVPPTAAGPHPPKPASPEAAAAPTPPAVPLPPPPLPEPNPQPAPAAALPKPAAEQPPHPPEPEPSPPSPTQPKTPGPEKLLRMILQELRAQRGSSGEFSYLTLIAVALQIVAIICLLGALWMGGDDVAMYARWLGVALMAQLGVIATLMFGK